MELPKQSSYVCIDTKKGQKNLNSVFEDNLFYAYPKIFRPEEILKWEYRKNKTKDNEE